jgi:hypothetical protein
MYLLFLSRYVMVLRSATSLRGALEGVGPENRDFFWALKWHERASAIWTQKSRDFQGPPLPMPQVMMLHSSKPLSISAIKTTGTLVVLCTRVLLCNFVVCCCVLEGWGGLLVDVLCEQVFRGWGWLEGLPLPLPL